MKKTFQRILKLIFTLLILGVVVYLSLVQSKFEKYIDNQKQKYHILQGKSRISHTPVFIYFLLKRDKINKWTSRMPYTELDLKYIVRYGYGDEYIMSCYYKYDEKLKYWEKHKTKQVNKSSSLLIKEMVIYLNKEMKMSSLEISNFVECSNDSINLFIHNK